MCYHYSLRADSAVLAERYGKKVTENRLPVTYAAGFEHPSMPVVTTNEIRCMHWGLIPSWVRGRDAAMEIRTKTLNVRCETLASKPAFSESFLRRRCLIPATGFFEWQHRGSQKVPFFISVKSESVFSFAGIFDSHYPEGAKQPVHTFSLLTTQANTLMEQIHNTKKRMPVMLTREAESVWLDASTGPDDLSVLFAPFDSSRMQAHTVAKPGSTDDLLKYVPYSVPSLFGEDSAFLDRFQ